MLWFLIILGEVVWVAFSTPYKNQLGGNTIASCSGLTFCLTKCNFGLNCNGAFTTFLILIPKQLFLAIFFQIGVPDGNYRTPWSGMKADGTNYFPMEIQTDYKHYGHLNHECYYLFRECYYYLLGFLKAYRNCYIFCIIKWSIVY